MKKVSCSGVVYVFATVLMLGLQTQAQKKSYNDTIFWSEDKILVRENFKANPKDKKDEIGNTVCSIIISNQPDTMNSTINFQVKAFFIKSKSWLLHPDKTYQMDREQVLFEMAELYARMLRKELLETTINFKDYKKISKRLLKEKILQYNKRAADYYKAIIQNEKQEVFLWKKNISAELKSLSDYNLESVSIKVNRDVNK